MNWKSGLCAGLLIALLSGAGAVGDAGRASAQPPPPGPRQGMGPRQATLASVPVSVLDANLKLTDEQKTNIQKIQDRYAEERKALMPQFSPGGPPPDRQTMIENFQKMRASDDKASKEIEAQLTDSQKKQLPDLLKDVSLYRSVNLPPELISELKLTPDQKKQLETIARDSQADMRSKMREAAQSGGFQAARDVMQKSRQATYEKALTVLTPDQKDKTVAYVKAHPQRDEGGFGPFGGFGFGPPPGGPQPAAPPPAGSP
jgi:hypothetical protein